MNGINTHASRAEAAAMLRDAADKAESGDCEAFFVVALLRDGAAHLATHAETAKDFLPLIAAVELLYEATARKYRDGHAAQPSGGG